MTDTPSGYRATWPTEQGRWVLDQELPRTIPEGYDYIQIMSGQTWAVWSDAEGRYIARPGIPEWAKRCVEIENRAATKPPSGQ